MLLIQFHGNSTKLYFQTYWIYIYTHLILSLVKPWTENKVRDRRYDMQKRCLSGIDPGMVNSPGHPKLIQISQINNSARDVVSSPHLYISGTNCNLYVLNSKHSSLKSNWNDSELKTSWKRVFLVLDLFKLNFSFCHLFFSGDQWQKNQGVLLCVVMPLSNSRGHHSYILIL